MQIKQFREKINKFKYEKDIIKKDLKSKNSKLLEYKKQFENLLKAQEIIQIVAQQTQNEIKFFITDIVNLALSSIPFENKPDSFEIEFVQRRNQIECDLYCIDKGNKVNPILSYGGGVNDILSLSLLIACWSLQDKKNNTIIFDEKLKYLSENLRSFAGEILKKLLEKLNLQIIFITHQKEYFEFADKIFEIKIKDGISEC